MSGTPPTDDDCDSTTVDEPTQTDECPPPVKARERYRESVAMLAWGAMNDSIVPENAFSEDNPTDLLQRDYAERIKTVTGIVTSILGAGLLVVAIAWLFTGMTIFQSVPLPGWVVHLLVAFTAYELIRADMHLIRTSRIPDDPTNSDDDAGSPEFGPGDEWEQQNL